MSEPLQLFAYIVIATLGFLAPILTILFSFFQDGIQRLSQEYQNKKSQTETNLEEQLKAKPDIPKIKETIQQLEDLKREAEKKLESLNPRKQTRALFIPLLLSYLLIICLSTLVNLDFSTSSFDWLTSPYSFALILCAAIFSFAIALIRLWGLTQIIVEVKAYVDKTNDERQTNIATTLGRLLESQSHNWVHKLFLAINNKSVSDKTELDLALNQKQEIQISVSNQDSIAVKNLEIGLRLPRDFLIEPSEYSIYTGEEHQIIRYNRTLLHTDTRHILNALSLKPIKSGSFRIRAWIKAENIKDAIEHQFTIKVK